MNRSIAFGALLFAFAAHSALVIAQTQPEAATNIAALEAPASGAGMEGAAATPASAVPSVTTTLQVVASGPDVLDALEPTSNVTQEEVLSSAGTFGDFSRYLQVLPGVTPASDLSNDVLVRGGHPTENLYVVDGVEVPNINHFSLSGSNGGFTTMIDTTAVGSMDLRDGIYDAGFSSRLSSLIEIHTRDLGDALQAGNLTIGIAGVGGLYQRALPHKGTFLATAHRSILNLITNDIGMNGVPVYTNGLSQVVLNPSERDSFTFFSLTGADSINMTPCQSPDATNQYQTQYSGWRTTDAMNWRHNYTSQVTSNLTASSSYTQQTITQQEQYGEVLDKQGRCHPVTLLDYYDEDSETGLSAVNYELRANFRGWLISGGGSAKLTTPDDSVAQPAGQQSPFNANPARSDSVTFKRNFASGQSAGFVQAEGALGKHWNLLAGLRAETFALTGGYALDPRVSVAYRLNNGRTIHGSFNVASELPPIMDMISYQSNRALKPVEARQATAGMRIVEAGWGTLDIDAYEKHYRREPVSTEYPQLMLSNMVDTLGQGFVWLPLTSAGTERSRGVELTMHAHWRNRTELLVSAARSQTTYRALDGIRRSGNYDFPLAVNAIGHVQLFKGIQLDMRDSGSSGRPYTPFDIADSLAQSRGIYDLSQLNAMRGQIYNRLDIDLERKFHAMKGVFAVHAGAENVLNRGNMMGYVWLDACNPSWGCGNSAGLPVTKVDQMGRYPSFNMRYEF